MSDIDFDELDRAVNSLVGGGAGSAKVDADISTPDKEVKPTPTPLKLGSSDSKNEASVNKRERSTVPSQRSAGRFMDVVHPSSVMNNGTEKPAIPSRRATSPVKDKIAGPAKETTTAKDTPQLSNDLEAHNKNAEKKWIDALSFLRKDDKSQQANAEVKHDSTTIEPDQIASAPTPIITPFLSDTKVTKRPLGGFGDIDKTKQFVEKESEVDPVVSGQTEPTVTDSDDQKEEHSAAPLDLPPEFDSTLIAIESDEALLSDDVSMQSESAEKAETFLDADEHKEAFPAEAESPVEKGAVLSTTTNDKKDQREQPPKEINYTDSIGSLLDKEKTDSPTEEKLAAHHDQAKISGLLASSSVVSIPQQYRRSDAASQLQSHPLFNADHYTQLPAAPVKRHSRLAQWFQWFFIIIGLVLLGGVFGTVIFVLLSGS